MPLYKCEYVVSSRFYNQFVFDRVLNNSLQLAELQAKIELTEEKLESKNSEVDKVQKTLQQQNKQLKEKTVAEAELQRVNRF